MKRSIKRKMCKQIKKTRLYKKIRRVKIARFILKALGKLLLIGVIAFASTFALYRFNVKNKLIHYVLRPLLNKRRGSQAEDGKN